MRWTPIPTKDYSRERWMELLSATGEASPYLLPEWAAFLERTTPGSTAKLWVLGGRDAPSAVVIALHRRRAGLEWCHALARGTPGGPLGRESTLSVEERLSLSTALTTRKMVEITCTPHHLIAKPAEWHERTLTSTHWLIRAAGATTDWFGTVSDEHIRNIRRGTDLEPEIRPVRTAADLDALLKSQPRVPHAARIALNRHVGAQLLAAFANSAALHWNCVWLNHRPAAGVIFLRYASRAVYCDGWTDRDAQMRGASHWLFARTLEGLIANGVRFIDLGAGPGGESSAGLDRFKSGWGADAETHTESVYRRRAWNRLTRLARR